MSEAKTIVIDVKGMTCQGCVNAVTRIVKRTDPQADVKIDLAAGRADVKTSAAPEAIAKAISSGGYEAHAR
jgi:copper chaperone